MNRPVVRTPWEDLSGKQTPGEVTVETLKTYLQKKKARIRDLQIHFGVPEEEILEIVKDPLNGIIIGDRDWLQLSKQDALNFDREEDRGRHRKWSAPLRETLSASLCGDFKRFSTVSSFNFNFSKPSTTTPAAAFLKRSCSLVAQQK